MNDYLARFRKKRFIVLMASERLKEISVGGSSQILIWTEYYCLNEDL